jgi:hypothetical protein
MHFAGSPEIGDRNEDLAKLPYLDLAVFYPVKPKDGKPRVKSSSQELIFRHACCLRPEFNDRFEPRNQPRAFCNCGPLVEGRFEISFGSRVLIAG